MDHIGRAVIVQKVNHLNQTTAGHATDDSELSITNLFRVWNAGGVDYPLSVLLRHAMAGRVIQVPRVPAKVEP